jgi:hypothetical protein
MLLKLTIMYLNLPKEIGAHKEIPVCDGATRRELEGRGFFIEKATLQHYVIRRDYADGTLKTNWPKS